jgi:hypothetical protein
VLNIGQGSLEGVKIALVSALTAPDYGSESKADESTDEKTD